MSTLTMELKSLLPNGTFGPFNSEASRLNCEVQKNAADLEMYVLSRYLNDVSILCN